MYILQGKPDTHDTCASHVSPHTPLVRFLRTVPVRGNLLDWPNRVGRVLLLLRKRAPDTIPSTPAGRATCPPPSLSPLIDIEAVMKAKALLTNITWPITLACDQYVQYLLVGANHRSLTNTGGGYNLGDLSLPHRSPQPSQPMILRFPLRAPPDLRLIIQPFSN
jgi:hypothetical protein